MRTLRVMNALEVLRAELADARNLPSEIRAAAIHLTDWVARHPHGIRRASISIRARDLLSEPLSLAFLGYVDGDVVDRASALDAKAIADLRAQISEARQFLPDLPFASSHLDGVCDALVALSRFFGHVAQVRRPGGGIITDHHGGAEVARTRTSRAGQEYCDYCHRPSQVYAHVHRRALSAALTGVSGPSFTSAVDEVHRLPSGLSHRFCDVHTGGSSNRWSKACFRNRDYARRALRSYRRTLERAGLFRPHSERIQRYVAELISSRKLNQVEVPRLRAGYRYTAPVAREILRDVFGPLGLPQDWLRVDEGLCEVAASSRGSFLRTSVDGAECYDVGPDELELQGWRAAFEHCTSTLKSYLHPRSGEAWLTVADPAPDPESPFSELPVADLSIVHPPVNYGGGDMGAPGLALGHTHAGKQSGAACPLRTLQPKSGLRDIPGPVLRVSFISPAWLSRVSLLRPDLSRGEP